MALLLLIPKIAYAQVSVLVGKINNIIINPLIILLFAAALAYFIFGVVEFLAKADSEEARAKGKQHILWGIVGMFIMLSVFTIMRIIMTTLGVDLGPGEVERGGEVILKDYTPR